MSSPQKKSLSVIMRKSFYKGRHILRRWRWHFLPPLTHNDLFPAQVILHFSQHKSLTGYYNKIMKILGDEFGFAAQHFASDSERFQDSVISAKRKGVFSLNNSSQVDFSKLPEFRGSHFVRDPRDLVVSGYRYHLWTREVWCIDPDFCWDNIVSHPYFTRFIEAQPKHFPAKISYQEYLKTLDIERGMILELVWRQFGFDEMLRWQFSPEIIELKYEEIVGNEVEVFRRIFEHYQFHPKLLSRGLEVVDEFSLKNMSKGDKKHVRKGTAQQWKTEFSPVVKDAFKELNGNLLIQLGYETENDW